MSTMTKVFVVLTSVLAIACSTLFIASSARSENWKSLAQDHKTRADAAITSRMQVQMASEAALAMKDEALAEKDRELAARRSKLRDRIDEIATLKSDLARTRSNLTASQASNTKLEEILGVNTGQLKSLQKNNQELLTQNLELQTRNSGLNGRNLELAANVTILTDEARNLQERLYASEQHSLKLQQQVAAGGPAAGVDGEQKVAAVPTVAGPIRGQIVDVNGRYASVSIGETSGVVPGMTFMIYRGDVFLGDLTVDRVRPKEAGGKLTLVSGEVHPGDPVVYGE